MEHEETDAFSIFATSRVTLPYPSCPGASCQLFFGCEGVWWWLGVCSHEHMWMTDSSCVE